MRAASFIRVGGYDQQLPYGSSCQDIELCHRVHFATGVKPKIVRATAGYSIPNAADTVVAVGVAKVVNCVDLMVAWKDMNKANWAYITKRGQVRTVNEGQLQVRAGYGYRMSVGKECPLRGFPRSGGFWSSPESSPVYSLCS